MNLTDAIVKLEQQRQNLTTTLAVLHSMNENPVTAEEILNHLRTRKSKTTKKTKKHWTQKPENRARMLRMNAKNLKKARAVKKAMLKGVK